MGCHPDHALGWLAGGDPVKRRFDSMVHGVAQKVTERGFKLCKHVPIYWSGGADDLQSHFFSEFSRQVTDHSLETARAVGKRSHVAGESLLIQAMGDACDATFEHIQLRHLVIEQALGFPNG